MKKLHFTGTIALTFLMGLSLAGCNKKQESSTTSDTSSKTEQTDVTSGNIKVTDKEVGFQLEPPTAGEEVALMTTSKGEIWLRFFPEIAPKAVENFKALSKKSYYNGLKFHRVIKGFMIQTGDPKGDGTGGESVWGKTFEDEFCEKLLNLRGSVAMANRGKNTNGSQFFINQTPKEDFKSFEMHTSGLDMSKVTEAIKKLYEETGGNPHLDGALSQNGRGHTVFAQVYKGMDVVDEIAGAEVKNDKPVQEITIKNIEIKPFE